MLGNIKILNCLQVVCHVRRFQGLENNLVQMMRETYFQKLYDW